MTNYEIYIEDISRKYQFRRAYNKDSAGSCYYDHQQHKALDGFASKFRSIPMTFVSDAWYGGTKITTLKSEDNCIWCLDITPASIDRIQYKQPNRRVYIEAQQGLVVDVLLMEAIKAFTTPTQTSENWLRSLNF